GYAADLGKPRSAANPPYDSAACSKHHAERDRRMRRILRERDVEAAVKGGAIFAAGGGGFADHGRMLGTAAVNAGEPELVTLEEVADDAWIATAAAIGAPAGSTNWQMLGVDYIKAVELAQRELG